jgi:hypothetical protein
MGIIIIPPATPPQKKISITIAKPKNSTFKTGQRYPTPPTTDSLYVFYTSLLQQNPKSLMAMRWCLEHGLIPIKDISKSMELLNPQCKTSLLKKLRNLELKSD